MLPHAYLILAHTDMAQLRVLIGMLDHPRHRIYLHADAKWRNFDPSQLSAQYSPIYILPKRIDVRWGATSIMHAEFELFDYAHKQGEHAYYHVISGADLPIKRNEDILDFFDKHQGKEFIEYWMAEGHLADARFKTDRYHFLMRYEKNQLPRILDIELAKVRHIIANTLHGLIGARSYPFPIYKGSNWVSITHQATTYLLERRNELCSLFQHTRNSDEIFIQSCLYSSPFRINIWELEDLRNPIRYLIWQKNMESPIVLTSDHAEALLSSACLFARKFSSTRSAALIDTIRTHLFND